MARPEQAAAGAGGQPVSGSLSEFDRIALLPDKQRDAMVKGLGRDGAEWLEGHWLCRARPNQLPPEGPWSTWLVMAGRGFGKTRLGAEWVQSVAGQDGTAAIALVGATLHEARQVMVEGVSGILAIAPRDQRPLWQPSRRELRWPSGARAHIYGASDPDMLRGPQHSHGWADEIGKWPMGVETWDNLAMGLRLGAWPRIVATTTPRPVPLVLRLHADPSVAVTRGRTNDNRAELPAAFLDEMERTFAGTRLGRQELDGELLMDVPGALWTRALLEQCRTRTCPARSALARVVVGVDPPASAHGDDCGIIVAGLERDGKGIVLEDASMARASPEQWASGVALAAERWEADRIVAEANNGGEMVRAVLRAADRVLPLKLVHASRGKIARAEPVSALYETGRIAHLGALSMLEDQLCGMTINGGYEGPGRSPDRADALVWALSELFLTHNGAARLRTF